MKLARVFPSKNNMTPADPDAYIGPPPMFAMNKYDRVNISCTFTWDRKWALYLKRQWEMVCKEVHIGGPAFNSKAGSFKPGMYLKTGAVITSRGCPNKCEFCLVPKREGKLRELEIHAGNNILDNNLLACSRGHIESVFKMLKGQSGVEFTGGLESKRLKDRHIDLLRSISLRQLFLAYDRSEQETVVKRAVKKLRKHFTRNQVRCYVLIGMEGDTLENAEHRLFQAWEFGTLPFAMLYRDLKETNHSKAWKMLQRIWARPAATKGRAKEMEECHDF